MKRFVSSVYVNRGTLVASRILGASVVVFCLVGAVNANLITNGDFESPALTTGFSIIDSGGTFGTSKEWQFGFGSYTGGVVWNAKNFSVGPAPQGDQFVSLNDPSGAGVMFQDFTVAPNTTYNVTFLFSGVSDLTADSSSTWGMFVGACNLDGTRVTYSDTYTVSMGTAAYLSVPTATLKTFSFTTGDETQERLAFFSAGVSSVIAKDSYFGPVIDNIQVTPAGVPEPTSIVLATMGVFGMLAYAWRRRK